MKTSRIRYFSPILLFVAVLLTGCSIIKGITFSQLMKSPADAASSTQPASTQKQTTSATAPRHTSTSAAPGRASPEPNEKTLTTGRFDGHRYINEYFGLTLAVPEEWYIASRDQIATRFGVGKECVGADDREEEAALGLEEQRYLYFFDISMYPNNSSKNIVLLCDNLEITSNYVDAKTYAQQSLDYLAGSDFPYEFSSIVTTEIDGREFAIFEARLDYGDRSVYQAIYCTVHGNYALSFILTADASDDLAIALYHAVIHSMKWD